MHNEKELSLKQTWSGRRNGLDFEICHWGVWHGEFGSMNKGLVCWNYYIYIYEHCTENFSEIWLEPKVKEFSPGGMKYTDYDYYSSPLAVDEWHGGITFWESGGLPKQRYIKIGCCFDHLWDQGRVFTLGDVLGEAVATTESIAKIIKLKSKGPRLPRE